MAACLIFLEALTQSSARAEPTAVAATHDGTHATDERALRLGGLVQVDAVPYHQRSVDELDPGSGQPLNRDRFSIPRAWLTGSGRIGYVRGLVQLQGSTGPEPPFRLLDAEITLGYPKDAPAYVACTLGLFLIPFGIETQEQVPRRMFLDASTWVGALFPGRRDLGAMLAGELGFVAYQLAVMNGSPSNSAAFPLLDPNQSKDVLGRIAAFGELARDVRLTVGGSGLWGQGFHAGSPPSKDTLVARDVNEDGIVQTSELQIVAGSAGEPSDGFLRHALGADFALDYALPVLGKGRLYGELAWAKNLDRGLFVADPVAQGRPLRELGGMLALRQMITRHVELGVRYDRYDGDLDASERRGVRIATVDQVVSTWAFAIALCTLSQFRLTAEYDHQTNPFGRTASGAPGTLASDSLTLRAQLEL